MSKYKPGQLVTIDHNVYRIRNIKDDLSEVCARCAFNTPLTTPQPAICCNCLEELGWRGYLEKVCGKQDK